MYTTVESMSLSRRCFAPAAVFLMSLLTSVAWAQSDAYLAGLPDAERVLREIRGKDDFDTAARQASAFYTLRMTTEDLTEGRVFRRILTPGEAARLAEYRQGLMAIHQRMTASFDPACHGPDCPRFRFNRLRMGLETSDVFKRQLWETLTAREWRERYVKNWQVIATATGSLPTGDLAAWLAQNGGPQAAPAGEATAAQSAASSRPELAVFGLVLDQPFTLPPCPRPAPGAQGAAALGMPSGDRFCWMPRGGDNLLGLLTMFTDVGASMNVLIVVPLDRRPQWLAGSSVFAQVDNGVLRAMEMPTTSDESGVSQMLREKYGKPSKVTPMTFSNDHGLKVEFNDYTWSGSGPYVFFRPFVDARNAGRLIIKGPMIASREAGAQEVQKKRELKL